MALVSQSIKNLKSGISQQPDILRFPEQGAAQVNGWSSETQGLKKRSPTIFDKVLGAAGDLGAAPLVHMINRDKSEQYNIVFTGTDIKAYKLDGTPVAVSYEDADARAYITTNAPRDIIRCTTVSDYTFVCNRSKVVAAGTATSGAIRKDGDAIIAVRGGQYGRTITVNINGAAAFYKCPNGVGSNQDEVAKMAEQVDAQYIIGQLITALKAVPGLAPWTFNAGPGFIHVIAPATDNIRSIEVTDGYANQLANVVAYHQVQSFAKLPYEAPNGYIVQIVGDTSRSEDAFFVHYDGVAKTWHETVGWGVRLGFNDSTMPHALVRQADGTFKFQKLTYVGRGAGDLDTNSDPSFVGQTINDIFFYRNRLGFLSGENVVLSRTAEYFKFFPASVANLSDDDPIDVAVSHNRISTLKFAVPFSEQLLLWSDQAQFVMSSSDATLTAKTVQLDLSTEFDISDAARPYGLGRGVYYASPRSAFSTINRYYAVQDVSDVKNSEDVTAHVPNYVPNGVYSIAGSTTENYVVVLSAGSKNKIYMYKFLYLDETIRQQSWSHWEFPADVEILSAEAIGSTLYVMARNEHNAYMTHVNFTKETTDFANEPYQLYLDIKKAYTIPVLAYDDVKYQTRVDVDLIYGMNFTGGDIIIVDETGLSMTFEAPAGGWPNAQPRVYLDGDWSQKNIFVGRAIDFRYEFSKFIIKSDDGNGGVQTQDLGRLQIRRAWLNYAASGAFTVDVTNANRTFSYDMTGKQLGSKDLVMGQLAHHTGQFRFSCCGNANEMTVVLHSKAPTPLNVIGCGWEGNFVNRARGI